MDTVRGAQASAMIYGIAETARANGLNVYYYLRHLLTYLPQLRQVREELEESVLEPLEYSGCARIFTAHAVVKSAAGKML